MTGFSRLNSISRFKNKSLIIIRVNLFNLNICRNGCTFRTLQGFNYVINRCFVKLRKIKMYFVKSLIKHYSLLQGGTYHSSKKLSNICIIYCSTEGHHRFCSRTVPTGSKSFFKEYNLNSSILAYSGRFFVRNIQTINLNSRSSFSKSVDDLTFHKSFASSFLNNS